MSTISYITQDEGFREYAEAVQTALSLIARGAAKDLNAAGIPTPTLNNIARIYRQPIKS